jgi:dTDP-4-dehydrorhamnose reductase
VDDAEEHRDAAFLVNEQGTRNVCAAAHRHGAYVITVSTDYVFNGSSEDGYSEGDITDPINVYGASKLGSEEATLQYPEFGVARTAWLFGEHGNNFVKTIAALAASRPELDVVQDQVGSPTWTMHLAEALVQAAEKRLAGVLHLAGSPTATWFDMAREVVRVTGADCVVKPTTSDKFVRPAARPACSILRVTRADTPTVGDWREGVAAVCATLIADSRA